ncbi:hypothetical protein [Stenotrophomonas sp. ATs4]|uniref:hypothetical protein n=1 Tax=Stenotrophomonas sp. ATs4 TaxID=3402766 RepID=UPI003F6E6D66
MAKKKPTAQLSQKNEIRYQSHHWRGRLDYVLEVFGDTLKSREGWQNDLEGLDAVAYYLMQKHHWTPAQIRAMSLEDQRFALSEEMHGWKLPEDALAPGDR